MLMKVGWSFTLIFILLLFDGNRAKGLTVMENDTSNFFTTPIPTTEETVASVNLTVSVTTILKILIEALKEQSNGKLSKLLKEWMDSLPEEDSQPELQNYLNPEKLQSLENLNISDDKKQATVVSLISLKPSLFTQLNSTDLNKKIHGILQKYNLNFLNQNNSIFKLYKNLNETSDSSSNADTDISYVPDNVQKEIFETPSKALLNQTHSILDKQNSFKGHPNYIESVDNKNNSTNLNLEEINFNNSSIRKIKSKHNSFKDPKASFVGSNPSIASKIKKLNSKIYYYLAKLDSLRYKDGYCTVNDFISKHLQMRNYSSTLGLKVMKYCNILNSILCRNLKIANLLSKISYKYWEFLKMFKKGVTDSLYFLLNKIRHKEMPRPKIKAAFGKITLDYFFSNTTFKYIPIRHSVINYLPEFSHTTRKPLRPPGRVTLGIPFSIARSPLAWKLTTNKEF